MVYGMFQSDRNLNNLGSMKKGFYELKVKGINKETPDTVSVSLEVPVDLRGEFQFKQGQYLTFETFLNGEEIRRSYSLCTSPKDEEWRVAIKKVPGGKFSTFANEKLKEGDQLMVMKPQGNFYTEVKPEQSKHYVFFAAGSGITPILSIVKTILLVEPKSAITLFYGNKNSSNIIFKEQLEALKNQHLGRFSIHYLLSRERMDAELFQGRLNKEKCKNLLSCIPDLKTADEFFLCGPLEMIMDIKGLLEEEGIDKKNIHFELFFNPDQDTSGNGSIQSDHTTVIDSSSNSRVTVKVDGVSFDFDLAYNGKNVLDAAIAKGADLPYSCKGGVCSTCRARLIEGTVDMSVNYALEEDELEDGYILTCQAHPRSEKIVVDFDQ